MNASGERGSSRPAPRRRAPPRPSREPFCETTLLPTAIDRPRRASSNLASAPVPIGRYDLAKVDPSRRTRRSMSRATRGGVARHRKAHVLRLRDRAGEVQLFCRADVLGADYAALTKSRVADFVEPGACHVTKTAAPVAPSGLRLLTKAPAPPPEMAWLVDVSSAIAIVTWIVANRCGGVCSSREQR